VANHSVAKNLKKNQLLILIAAVLLVAVVLYAQLALLAVLLHLALVLQEEQHTVAAVAAK
jgi:hypothetical protein